MRIHWESKLAQLILANRYVAFTFGKHVFIKYAREELTNETRIKLLAHEECHVKQYERMGILRFLLTYLWQWIRYGYEDMPLEKECR